MMTTEQRRRCAMIVNPYSSSLTSTREREIVRQLRERVDLDVLRTERSGHATRLARQVLDGGQHDVVIACGGDGTVNEILNGLSLEEDSADHRPALAIVPAGGTNVVARSLGYPNHPVRATSRVIDAIVNDTRQRINVASVDERLFLFAAGVGLDGEIIKRMEQRRSGRRPSDAAHLAAIFGIYATARFALTDRMTIAIKDSHEELRSAMLFVGNTSPTTYLGRIPVHFLPDAQFDSGLDLIAPQRASALFAIRNVLQAVGVGRQRRLLVSPEAAQCRSDVSGFTVECDEPEPVQVDGEYIGDRTHITFGIIERAIDIIA